MSGGRFDYMYSRVQDVYCGHMEDDELNGMMTDLCDLLYELEWYKSGDTDEHDYQKCVKKFKKKWIHAGHPTAKPI